MTEITFGVLILTVIVLVGYTTSLKAKVKKLSKSNSDEPPMLPGYGKFLADSREQAYVYIEEVQGGIYKFLDKIQPLVTKSKSKNVDEIKGAIEELSKLVPPKN